MSELHKQSIIERLRAAQRWCAQHGAPYEWLRQLLCDTTQELQGESGALWMQWSTREGHIRIFVAGEMNLENLDLLMEALTLSRDTLERRRQRASETLTEPASAAHSG